MYYALLNDDVVFIDIDFDNEVTKLWYNRRTAPNR